MSWLEMFVACWLTRRMVKQGHHHKQRITMLLLILRMQAEREFYEDNQPTLHSFLSECFQDALKTEVV